MYIYSIAILDNIVYIAVSVYSVSILDIKGYLFSRLPSDSGRSPERGSVARAQERCMQSLGDAEVGSPCPAG